MASGLTFRKKVALYREHNWITPKIEENILRFYDTYYASLQAHNLPLEKCESIFDTYLDLVKQHLLKPFLFKPYHHKVCHPFDFYAFGVNFLRPLVDEKKSTVSGKENLEEIAAHLQKKNNVIFFANHQIEADPQALSILLENLYPEIGSDMIFVAGERVLTDPLAVPFSMGRNLLCIYSKRYIDTPPEKKTEKQLHNKRTMELMSSLLKEGGKCIYVAPSGGRDRANAEGVVEVAQLDPQNIKMFYLMAQKAEHPTFFYPMALSTYDLLPPPETIQVELGEQRNAKRGAIHLSIGECLDMETFPGSDHTDKQMRRQARADYVWKEICKNYRKIVR